MAYVVFDFDGTLADMKTILIEVAGEIAVKKGWPEVNEQVYERLRKGNIKDGLKSLNIPFREVPFAILQAKRMLLLRTDEIELFPDIPKLVDELIVDGHKLFVLSTNSKKVIKSVLVRHKLADKLTVLPSSGLFGKAPALKRFMRTHKANSQQTWLIGDELRDIEAAKKAGVSSMAVTWGLQHPDTLKASKPTFVVNTPAQILKNLHTSA